MPENGSILPFRAAVVEYTAVIDSVAIHRGWLGVTQKVLEGTIVEGGKAISHCICIASFSVRVSFA